MPKQTTDVSGGSYGIVYTSAGQAWTIAKGVTVSGTSGAVLSEFPDSTLINRGTASSEGYGLYLAPGGTGDVDIVNGGAGVIDAYRAILILDMDGALSLFNKGLVEGSEYAVSISGSFSADIRNEGVVRADLAAINFQALGSSDGISFKNAGKIVGGTYAIEVATLAYGTAKIVNTENGIIKGGDAAIAVAERLVVKSDGLIGGRIVSGGYNDKVINKNKVKGDVWLGGGSDLFVNKGKAKAGMIDPGPGLDIVVLGFRSDKLLFRARRHLEQLHGQEILVRRRPPVSRRGHIHRADRRPAPRFGVPQGDNGGGCRRPHHLR